MNNNNGLSFSICLPVYKGSHILKMALDSIFRQNFNSDYEIVIGEDTPLECNEEIKAVEMLINSYDITKIKYIKNSINLGYAVNLQNIVRNAKGEVLFLMAQDDILSKDSLQKTHDAFFLDNDIGCVTRPYYWFVDNFRKPVRVVTPYNIDADTVISVKDKGQFMKIFGSIGQLSGLAYKRNLITVPFNEECFPAHIYPFAGILRSHKCVFLKDYTVAIGILDSQTRLVESIYDVSPTESWLKMYKTVFTGEEFKEQSKWALEHICKNYMGFVQLKNYAKPGILLREIIIFIRERPKNLLNLKFWFFALGTLIIPAFILRRLVDWYKDRVIAKTLTNIQIDY